MAAVECTPISGDYRIRFIPMPPPSSGGIHIVQLNILENFDMQKYGFCSADAMQTMQKLRNTSCRPLEYLGDPDFTQSTWQAPTTKLYAKPTRSNRYH